MPKKKEPPQPLEHPQRMEGKHMAKCALCQHPEREEIEQRYLEFADLMTLDREYIDTGIGYYTMRRHMIYFKLDERRMKNRRAVYEAVARKGVEVVLSDPELLGRYAMDALKHLDRLDGVLQKPRDNQADFERKQKVYAEMVERIVRESREGGNPLTTEQAVDGLSTHFPDMRNVLDATQRVV